jgi:hypothetical protein
VSVVAEINFGRGLAEPSVRPLLERARRGHLLRPFFRDDSQLERLDHARGGSARL